jgi:hypothetical protein
MKKSQPLYSLFQKASAIIMIVALSWLTISAPFVFENQKKIAQQENAASADLAITGTEEEANPFSGTTEEKAPKTLNSVSEEYLHDNHRSEYFFSIASQFHKAENASIYVAYHGEMLVPPPNKA